MSTTYKKPCLPYHGEYLEGCQICWNWRYADSHAKFRNGAATAVAPKQIDNRLGLPCIYRRNPTGKKIGCQTCTGNTQLHLYECDVYGECTLYKRVDGVACCDKSCKARVEKLEDEKPIPTEFKWISTSQLVTDSIYLAGLMPTDLSGVVGIPRSGMIPATIISTFLHLPLYELAGSRIRRLGNGSRGHQFTKKSGGIVVVDDTVYMGTEMRKARGAVKDMPALFAAVYCRPEKREVVDLYAKELPSPHLLEWNVVNAGPFAGFAANPVFKKGVATDLDGIICHDEESGGSFEMPYLLPRARPCPLIVTGRHESARKQTEAWLTEKGVSWVRLEMLPNKESQSKKNIAKFKAKHFKDSECGFFLESCPIQAELIAKFSGKPVICPKAGRVFTQA